MFEKMPENKQENKKKYTQGTRGGKV